MKNFDVLKEAARVLTAEAASLQTASEKLDENFVKAVEVLKSASPGGRVIVVGMGKSGHIGNKIAATLASTGTPAFTVHPAEAGHGDLGMITANDIVLGISQSGKSDELIQILPYIKRHAIKLVAMTGNAQSPLGEAADVVINTGVENEACPLGLAPTTSTTLTLALGDALAVCLLQQSGFDSKRFAETHPNGLLGRKLLVKVKDAMSPLEEIAIVSPNSSIKESLPKIAAGKMGIAIVGEDTPVGVFTDGDLRRCLDAGVDINVASIHEHMTKDFLTVNLESLAVEAVELMGQKSIGALPVVSESGRLEGALSMKELITVGVL